MVKFLTQKEKNFQIKATLADIRRLKATRASGVFECDNERHDRCEWAIGNLKKQLTRFRNATVESEVSHASI